MTSVDSRAFLLVQDGAVPTHPSPSSAETPLARPHSISSLSSAFPSGTRRRTSSSMARPAQFDDEISEPKSPQSMLAEIRHAHFRSPTCSISLASPEENEGPSISPVAASETAETAAAAAETVFATPGDANYATAVANDGLKQREKINFRFANLHSDSASPYCESRTIARSNGSEGVESSPPRSSRPRSRLASALRGQPLRLFSARFSSLRNNFAFRGRQRRRQRGQRRLADAAASGAATAEEAAPANVTNDDESDDDKDKRSEIPCVHRESSSVVQALHNLSPTDNETGENPGDKYGDKFGKSSAVDGGADRDPAKAVFIEMTTNRYKRTEFEEGDGESVGGSSIDSNVVPGAAHAGGFHVFDPSVAFRGALKGAWLGRRTRLELILGLFLFIAVVVIFSLAVRLSTVKQAVDEKKDENPTAVPETHYDSPCLTTNCVKFASSILSSLDESVDPCHDFYDFACGGWIREHPIPAGRSTWGTFGVLQERNQRIMKAAVEEEVKRGGGGGGGAKMKVADYFASCVDEEKLIDELGDEPLRQILRDVGFWNLTGNFSLDAPDADGVAWNLEARVTALHSRYANNALFGCFVGVDEKNSTWNVLSVDQNGLTLSRNFYLNDTKESNRKVLAALEETIVNIAVLLGGDEAEAKRQASDIVSFEKRLANITIPNEERRDESSLYHKMTLAELTTLAPFIDWTRYVNARLDFAVDDPEVVVVDERERVVVYAPEYLRRLDALLEEYSSSDYNKTVLNNYLVWHTVYYYSNFLTEKYRRAKTPLSQATKGSSGVVEKWKECVEDVDATLGFALGAMFVDEAFKGRSKLDAKDMIGRIRASFEDSIRAVSWMDDVTRKKALEKADAVTDMVGYPDFITDTDRLDDYYDDLSVDNSTYFDNVVAAARFGLRRNLRKLRKKVDRKKWDMTPPQVNAYYEPTKNEMVFPAGILQVPFYDADYPKSLNFGGIGVVMGHELTHGFDDQGSEYDKSGNLASWWTNDSLTHFKEHAKCLVDQYSSYTIDGEKLNGKLNLGENIADNGGLKAAFKAFSTWRSVSDVTDPILPGVNLTSSQLFFVGFAQVWCASATRQSSRSDLMADPHAPPKWRVIGTLSNSREFSREWNCGAADKMNPPTKCEVW